jgi:hypothetical protein
VIHPTIGRKVWYYDQGYQEGIFNSSTPCDATVVYVWSDVLVNLRVTKHSGDTIIRTSVPLRDLGPHDVHGSGVSFATWTQHQAEKARKLDHHTDTEPQ